MKRKEWLKRYRVFLILLVVNVALGIAMPDLGAKSWSATKANVLEMLSILPPVFVLLGLLDVWVDRATMMKYTGPGSGLKGILISFLLGSAAAGPLYAAFPVATVMLKKGSSLFHVLVFLGAWSTTKIPMLTFEAANLGVRFMLTRLVLSIVGILIIAWFVDRALPAEEKSAIYERSKKA